MKPLQIASLALVVLILLVGVSRVRNHPQVIEETDLGSGEYYFSLEHDGLDRTYGLYIPKSYDGESPVDLVFSLHGAGGSAKNAKKITGFNKKAEEEGFVVVYPEGIEVSRFSRNLRTWNAGDCKMVDNNADDVGFISDLIDKLEGMLAVDHVYVSGMSNGAMMTQYLACELSDKIDAVASVAGALSLDFNKCNPVEPIPIMHIHGLLDPLVKFGGGTASELDGLTVSGCNKQPILDVMLFWRDKNNCSKLQARTSYQKGSTLCLTNDSCSGGSEVTLCTISNAGHVWPLRNDMNATDYIWDNFFSKY
jgi:polyhydroxybutyrate depolymerase